MKNIINKENLNNLVNIIYKTDKAKFLDEDIIDNLCHYNDIMLKYQNAFFSEYHFNINPLLVNSLLYDTYYKKEVCSFNNFINRLIDKLIFYSQNYKLKLVNQLPITYKRYEELCTLHEKFSYRDNNEKYDLMMKKIRDNKDNYLLIEAKLEEYSLNFYYNRYLIVDFWPNENLEFSEEAFEEFINRLMHENVENLIRKFNFVETKLKEYNLFSEMFSIVNCWSRENGRYDEGMFESYIQTWK